MKWPKYIYAAAISVVGLVVLGGIISVGVWALGDSASATSPDMGMAVADTQQSEQIGGRIVAAIVRYKVDHGGFPSTLSDLSPRYLEDIKSPIAGTGRWVYRAERNGQWFSLAFGQGADLYPKHYITSENLDRWNRDY